MEALLMLAAGVVAGVAAAWLYFRSERAVLAERVTVRFGAVPAEVQWAGLSGAGLYQLNVVVPDLPDGDVEVVAEIGGVTTGPGDFVPIQRR